MPTAPLRLGRSFGCAVALTGVLSLGSACIINATFDPIGTDRRAEGRWLVNGAAPTQESCAAAGIDFVRVRFFDVSRTADHPRLVFPCAQGSFDTRPDGVIAAEAWNIALVAIDAEGNAVVTAPPERVEPVDVSGHLVLTPADFVAP